MIRIALLGCGAMGEAIARRIHAVHNGLDCRVAAAIDTRPDRAALVGDLLGVPAFTSLAEAHAHGIDAVDIRLPHHLHAEAALAAIERGLPVLIEKPVATTPTDALDVVRAADRAGVVAAVAENYPHLRAVRAATDAIAEGAIGELVTVRTTRAYQLGGVWVRDGWRRGGGPSSGILLDQGTHHTSLLRAVAGEIDVVSAQSAPDGETVLLTARFAGGLIGQSLYTWRTPPLDGEPEATVFGTTGRIDIGVSYQASSGHAVRHDGAGPQPLSEAENYYDSHRLIIADWVAAITEHREPLVSARDASRDLAVVLAAQASLNDGGRPVEVTA